VCHPLSFDVLVVANAADVEAATAKQGEAEPPAVGLVAALPEHEVRKALASVVAIMYPDFTLEGDFPDTMLDELSELFRGYGLLPPEKP
jgi:hypothetical protein